MSRHLILCALAVLSVVGLGRAAEPKTDPAGAEFFEKKIRPLLVERCFECHTSGKKPKADLALDSRTGMLKGGDNGPALVPGDPEKSLIIQAIRYDDTPKMPPRSKLPAQAVADLTAWVKMGAPWPGGDKAVAASKFEYEKFRKHWSFQPVKAGPPPDAKEDDLSRNPLDRFIRARLGERGLKPSPAADRRTLVRRVTFDLT